MTRSSRRAAYEEDTFEDERRKKFWVMLGNMAMVIIVIVGGWQATLWILSDMTGEYRTYDDRLGSVSLCLVRKATRMIGELSYGRGAILVLTQVKSEKPENLDLVFELPQEWVDKGQKYRQVEFRGKIEDTIVTGTIYDGQYKYDVKLFRDSIASIKRNVMALLPWVN